MAFDAGSIEATLTIATAQASADLAKISSEVKALTDNPHDIPITANTDQASTDIAKLAAEVAALADAPHDIVFTASTGEASADIAKLAIEIKALEDQAHAIKFGATADTGEATADVAKAAAEVDALTDTPHDINIGAVFDSADLSLARRAFALLDNAISADAMQRLRSSPQGSVLGALNALFSPHPVIGGPSPQASAASGLLGQMVSAQGGGNAAVPGTQGETALRDVVTGEEPEKVTVTEDAAQGEPAAGAGDLTDAADAEKAAAAAEAAAAGDTRDAAADLKDAASDLKESAALGSVGALQKYLGSQRSAGGVAPAVAAGTGGGEGVLPVAGAAAATEALAAAADAAQKSAADIDVTINPASLLADEAEIKALGGETVDLDVAFSPASLAALLARKQGLFTSGEPLDLSVGAALSPGSAAALRLAAESAVNDIPAAVSPASLAEIKADIAAVTDGHDIAFNDTAAEVQLAALLAQAEALGGALRDFKVGISDAGASLILTTLITRTGQVGDALTSAADSPALDTLAEKLSGITVTAETLGTALNKTFSVPDIAPLTDGLDGANEAAQALEATFEQSMPQALGNLDAGLKQAREDFADLADEMGQSGEGVLNGGIPFVQDATGALGAYGAAVKALTGELTALEQSGSYSAEEIAAMQARVAAARADLTAFAAAAGAAAGGNGGNGGVAGLTAAAGAGGRAIGGWGGILAGTIGGIGLWHVALDGAMETIIAVTTAAAALTVGLAAMASTAIDVYNHIQAVNDVNSAFGDQINVFGGQFRNFAEGVENSSHVLEIYGGAVSLASSQTGGFVKIANEVVIGFDDWIAKLNLWSAAQGGFSGILQTGVNFLKQFAQIADELGVALDNLVKDDPGTAHMLLDIVSGAAKVLDVITSLPAPLVQTGLALHSMYLWGSVLGGVLGNLPGKFGLVGDAIVAIAHNPATLLLSAMAFEMERSWDTASAGVVKDITSINSALSTMTASDAVTGISADIGTLNAEMSQVSIAGIESGWSKLNSVWQESDDKIQAIGHDIAIAFSPGSMNMHGLEALGDVVKDVFDQGAAESQAAVIQFQHDIGAYQNEISSLLGAQKNLFTATGDLTDGQDSFGVATHNVAQSLALLNLAGVQYTDSLPLMLQKVQDLVSGYQAMSVQGAALSAAVDAITFATEQQQSKVSSLNSAWDTFISTVTGGQSGFLTFAQQVTGLYQSMTTGGVKLADSGGKVSSSLALLASTAGSTKVSMTGLNTASVTAQQTFLQSVTAANSQMDALTTLASAAGLGAQGTSLLSQANKDLVASLLPAVQGSTTLTTTLYALAQRGGYTGADSFKQLSEWVGKTADPMTNLEGITGKLTTAAGNLTTDVQNLATALHQDLNGAMAQVILTETGGVKPMEDLYTAIATTGLLSSTTEADALALGDQFLRLTGNVSDAKGEFVTFAEQALNLTQTQADALWSEISGKLAPSVAGVGNTAVTAANQIDQTFIGSLDKIINSSPTVTGDVDNFTSAVLGTGNASTQTQGARAKLISDLENAGLMASTAKGLVDGLQQTIDALHGKSVAVTVDATAQGTLNAIAHIPGQALSTDSSLVFAASGMLVSGGTPGKDSVLIAAMPGEVVVPTAMVNAGAVDHLRGSIPGFAAGGIVNLDAPGQWAATQGGTWAQQVEQAWASASQSAFNQSATAAVAAMDALKLSGSAGSIQAMMQAAAAARGWTGAEWAALNSVEEREAGYNPNAVNPTSGAYGLAQFIGGQSEYYQYGGNPTSAAGQITGMLAYIAQRYGDPEGAWAHEQAFGWYDKGGTLQPGWTVAYNGTGRPEQVTSPSQADRSQQSLDAIASKLDRLILVSSQAPAATGQHVGAAIGGAAQGASFRSRYPRNN